MNTVALSTLLAGVLTVLVSAATTVWNKRGGGPEAHVQIVHASTKLLDQLQLRIEALETRVAGVEAENLRLEETVARYHYVHGPLED